MKDYARSFYKGQAWKTCRAAYARKKHYLCEDCLLRGIYTPGEIVHHVVEITPDNINDPRVTLNPDNLRLVCRKCHGEAHSPVKKGRRYVIAEDGAVIVRE